MKKLLTIKATSVTDKKELFLASVTSEQIVLVENFKLEGRTENPVVSEKGEELSKLIEVASAATKEYTFALVEAPAETKPAEVTIVK